MGANPNATAAGSAPQRPEMAAEARGANVAAGRRRAAGVWLPVLAIACWTAHSAFVLGDTTVHDEDHFLENTQAALLLLSTLVCVHAAVTGRRADLALLLVLAWTFLGMALRELDLERLQGVPQ